MTIRKEKPMSPARKEWERIKRAALNETLAKRQRENDYVDARLPKQYDIRQMYK